MSSSDPLAKSSEAPRPSLPMASAPISPATPTSTKPTNATTTPPSKNTAANNNNNNNNNNSNNNNHRVTLACERCRRRHIRCSGGEPCNSCKRTNSSCVYVEAEKKIVVSIKYIQNLQAQIAALREGRDPSTVLTTAQAKKLAKSQRDANDAVSAAQLSSNLSPINNNNQSTSLGSSRSVSVTSIINLINDDNQSKNTTSASSSPLPPIKIESIPEPTTESNETTTTNNNATNNSNSITNPNPNNPDNTAEPDIKKRKLSDPTSSEVIPGLNNHTKNTFSKSDSGTKYYIGASSMSLFGLELQGLLDRHKRRQHTHESNSLLPPRDNKFLEATFSRQNGGVYKLAIGSANSVTEQSSAIIVPFTLPTYQDALHYTNNFHLNLSGSFYFFNLGRTLSRIQRTYDFNEKLGPNFDNVLSSREEAIWYCHMLLIFAVGEMYSTPERWVPGVPIIPQKPSVPPGAQYFNYASELFFALYQGELLGDCSIQSVEIFLIIGFYLQVCDYPTSYFVYHGICLRTALLLGLHVDADNQQLNPFEREHRRRLFWTVYIFEHYLSAKAGLPLGISDDQIDLPYPQDIDPSNIPPPENAHDTFPPAALMVSFIEVTKISSEILTSLYRPRRNKESNILPILNDIIVQLFDWRQNLPISLRVDFSQKELKVDRTLCNIYTDYFQCVNLLVRPLLFYFVKKRIGRKAVDKNPIDLSGYSKNILTLLNASFKASINCIRSLYSLMPCKQLAIYSYMDREYIFGSAATLILFNTAFGVNQTTAEHINCVLEMLGLMAEVGNFPAKNRRDQLINLISAFDFSGDASSTSTRASEATKAPPAPITAPSGVSTATATATSAPVKIPKTTRLSPLPSISMSNNHHHPSHPHAPANIHLPPYQQQPMRPPSRPTSPFPHLAASPRPNSPHGFPGFVPVMAGGVSTTGNGRGFGASGFGPLSPPLPLPTPTPPPPSATSGHISPHYHHHHTMPYGSGSSYGATVPGRPHHPGYVSPMQASYQHHPMISGGSGSSGITGGNTGSPLTGSPHSHLNYQQQQQRQQQQQQQQQQQRQYRNGSVSSSGSVGTPTPLGQSNSNKAVNIGTPTSVGGTPTGSMPSPNNNNNSTAATTTTTPPVTSTQTPTSAGVSTATARTTAVNNNDLHLGLDNSSFFTLDSSNNLFDPSLEFSPESISLFFGDGGSGGGLSDFNHGNGQGHGSNMTEFMLGVNNESSHNNPGGATNMGANVNHDHNHPQHHPAHAAHNMAGSESGYVSGLMDKERELWHEIANQSAWLSSMGDDFNSLVDH